MKKLVALLLAIVLSAGIALAEGIDLSGMSYDELVALKDRINIAMWQSDEWQEVTVPQGVWKVGEDIPAGHWTVSPLSNFHVYISVGKKLNDEKTDIDVWNSNYYIHESIMSEKSKYFDENKDKPSCNLELENGMYVVIDDGSVVFTPYQGKPSLGFK